MTRIHPHYHKKKKKVLSSKERSWLRMRWELVAFSVLAVVLTVLKVVWKYEFPDAYISTVERATLAVEVFGFFIGEG